MKDLLLVRPAEILLLASFGISLLFSIRKGEGLYISFERFIIGFLSLIFYKNILDGLFNLGKELDTYLISLGSQDDLKAFIVQSLYQASTTFQSQATSSSLSNLGNYIAQVFRTGIWGVISSITEIFFLMAYFLLEVGRDALWRILIVLFPIGAAMFPILPKILFSMLAMAVELILWLPILTIINVATSELAREYSRISYDIGFYVLALEIISIVLTFSTPIIAHKLVSGSLNGSMLEPWKRTLSQGISFFTSVPSISKSIINTSSGLKRLSPFKSIVFILFGTFYFSHSLYAMGKVETIFLSYGFLKKIECKGKLYISALGNEKIITREALPSSLGCGLVLIPQNIGKTNLILETSTGTQEYLIEVKGNSSKNAHTTTFKAKK